METTKRNFNEVSGMIIVICAIAIAILNLNAETSIDSFILPFILLMVGIRSLSQKKSEEAREIKVSPKKRKIVIATLSISLIAGIVTLMITLL